MKEVVTELDLEKVDRLASASGRRTIDVGGVDGVEEGDAEVAVDSVEVVSVGYDVGDGFKLIPNSFWGS